MPAVADEYGTAEGKYQAKISKALHAYNATIQGAFEDHFQKLTALHTTQAKRGNRDGDENPRDRIDFLKREGPPLILEPKMRLPLQSLMPRLEGNWVVT